jgi:hypothetical protein
MICPSRGNLRGPVRIHDQGGRRQGRAVRRALAVLGMADARVFLNSRHPGLSARPLDLARRSDAGLAAVEAAIGAASARGR